MSDEKKCTWINTVFFSMRSVSSNSTHLPTLQRLSYSLRADNNLDSWYFPQRFRLVLSSVLPISDL